MNSSIYSFEKEVVCEYRGNTYSVRDNGMVMRHAPKGKKKRPLDEQWDFGRINRQKGYLTLGDVPVHRIVAYAFLGEPPTDKHVVDHIDTNKMNNRPENLRWVTRLENIILNDITRAKIEKLCGCPIEEVLKDMSILHDKDLGPNLNWMKIVNPIEAKNCLENWTKWAKDIEKVKSIDNYERKASKNIYYSHGFKVDNTSLEFQQELYSKRHGLEMSPANAKWFDYQYYGCFKLCPETSSLSDYEANLKKGAILFEPCGKGPDECFMVDDWYYNKDEEKLYICCSRKAGVKTIFLATIVLKDNIFYHDMVGYFDPNSLNKYFTIAKGEEWTGGEVFDDYC